MKFITVPIFYLVLTLFFTHIASAHGVIGAIAEKKALLVTAEYDDGEPMSYGAVEIINLEEKLPFQSGRTDRNGRFLFLPDRAGEWQVTISDGMGHQVIIPAKVNENMAINMEENQMDENQKHGLSHGGSLPRYERILMGISFIFGIFGFLFWWKGRKNKPVV